MGSGRKETGGQKSLLTQTYRHNYTDRQYVVFAVPHDDARYCTMCIHWKLERRESTTLRPA
jgi:hypothetical protein